MGHMMAVCQTEIEGIHLWPEAPDQVYYLRKPHRHMFKIRVEIEVEHNNREIEIIQLRHALDGFLRSHMEEHSGKEFSCEMLAKDIYHYFLLQFLLGEHKKVAIERKINIEVLEDGENGAKLIDLLKGDVT